MFLFIIQVCSRFSLLPIIRCDCRRSQELLEKPIVTRLKLFVAAKTLVSGYILLVDHESTMTTKLELVLDGDFIDDNRTVN